MDRRAVRPGLAMLAGAVFVAPAGAFDAVAQEVDRAALMRDLSVLAHDSLGGRAVGSEGSRMARAHIAERLRGLGLDVAADTFALGSGPERGVNLRARIPGTVHSDRYLVLTAHYDHMGVVDGQVYNGADDNASGVSVLLQLAADLRRDAPLHSVVLLFLDAEEGGLRGARAFVAEPSVPLEAIVLNLNLDMVSRTEGELWAVGTAQYPGLRPFVETVEPAPPAFIRFGHDTEADRGSGNWVEASDHAAFHRAGIPFLYFGVSDHPDYHRPTDDVDAVDPIVFEAVAETLRRVLRSLDAGLNGERSLH